MLLLTSYIDSNSNMDPGAMCGNCSCAQHFAVLMAAFRSKTRTTGSRANS